MNQTVLKVNLSHNCINDVQGSLFLHMLTDNSVLKEINLSNNCCSVKTSKMIH